MHNGDVPLTDIIVGEAIGKVKGLRDLLESKDAFELFMEIYNILENVNKIHVINDDIKPLDSFIGIDGAYAVYKMFGGIVGIYGTIAVVPQGGLVIPEVVRYGVETFVGDSADLMFQLKEYTEELLTVIDILNKTQGSIPVFVDGSLSSSMGHLHILRESQNSLKTMISAVEQILKAINGDRAPIVFVPKRTVKNIAFEDPLIKNILHAKGLVDNNIMSLSEPMIIGNAILKKRFQWRNKKDKRALMPIVVGPFPLIIDLTMDNMEVVDAMNTYYINLWQWRHSILRIDVGKERNIAFIKRVVLPALDLAPRVACVLAADEYAKSVISTAMNNFLNALRSSPEFSDVLKILPDYRGEGSMEHSVFFGE